MDGEDLRDKGMKKNVEGLAAKFEDMLMMGVLSRKEKMTERVLHKLLI